MPPPELANRIGGQPEDYAVIGAQQAVLLRALLPEDWSWEGKRVLDFGCGTARTLVHFSEEAATGELWGCDIDVSSIEWAQRTLSPPFHFLSNDELPPLDRPDASYDLVYGFSVFTHLVDTWSVWLLELHRVLDVGGYGFFTFLGQGMIEDVAEREWDEDRVGMIGLDLGKPWSIGGPNVLHSEWWLRAHWGRLFEIVSVRPATDLEALRGHGIVVFRKDDRPVPTREKLERAEPDEPREQASLQFAVEILQERTAKLWEARVGAPLPAAEPPTAPAEPAEDQGEIDRLRREGDRLRAEHARLREELHTVTTSKSWRVTAPLRAARRRTGR